MKRRSRMEGRRGQEMDLITDYVASSHEKYSHIQVYKQVEVEIGKGRSRKKPKKRRAEIGGERQDL